MPSKQTTTTAVNTDFRWVVAKCCTRWHSTLLSVFQVAKPSHFIGLNLKWFLTMQSGDKVVNIEIKLMENKYKITFLYQQKHVILDQSCRLHQKTFFLQNTPIPQLSYHSLKSQEIFVKFQHQLPNLEKVNFCQHKFSFLYM